MAISISNDPTSKDFEVVGDPGSTFTLQVTNAAGEYYDFETDEFGSSVARLLWQEIDSTGSYSGNILIPGVTSDDTYTVTLFAEGHFGTTFNSNISSTNIIERTIKQYVDRRLTFSLASTASSAHYNTLPSDVVVLKNPFTGGMVSSKISWPVTLSARSFINIRQPLETDFKTTTTQTVNGAISSASSVVLDSVAGLIVGMDITAVSSGSLAASTSITAVDIETKTITISENNTFADGITLTFTGYGTAATSSIHGTSFKLTNFKVVLDDVEILTDATSSNATIPLADTNGLLAITTQDVDGNSATNTITLDAVTNLAVGQKLVACSACVMAGEPFITAIDGKVLTLSSTQKVNDGETLTFAKSEISGIGVGCDGTKTTYVHSISSGASVVAKAGGSDVTNDLESGQTMTFKGSSRSATITADVDVITMGITEFTTTLELDNILTVIA